MDIRKISGIVIFVGVVVTGTTVIDTPVFSTGARYVEIADTGLVSRITPQNDAKENEYPFAVYLTRSTGNHYCSGSLVERRWVLTAAHCLRGSATHVVLGDYDRSTNESSSKQVIEIAEQIPHPNFSNSAVGIVNDVGLIRLASPANVRTDAVAKVVPLESAKLKAKFLENKKKCLVLGWGLMKAESVWSTATKLQQLPVRFVNDSEATERGYTLYPNVLSTEAVYEDECRIGSICNGDSGGPVVCKNGGEWIQVGLTSYYWQGWGCMTGISGTADVQHAITWIQSVVNK